MRPRPPKLSDSTIEHIRCVVPEDDVRGTALVMLSGMFPAAPDTSETPPHTRALRWFGEHMFPAPVPTNAVLPSFHTRTLLAKQRVDELAGYRGIAVIDLVHITHSAAVVSGEHRLHGQMCGFATLSLVGTSETATLGVEGLSYGARQLRLPYVTTDVENPELALRRINDTVMKSRTDVAYSARATAVPISVLADGRNATIGALPFRSARQFAEFADDSHDIWSLIPHPTGEDIDYDALLSELAGTAYYRVFDAVLSPRTNRKHGRG